MMMMTMMMVMMMMMIRSVNANIGLGPQDARRAYVLGPRAEVEPPNCTG